MAASTSAISSYKVFLMYKKASGSTYEKLVDIKSYPDLGGTPQTLQTTTLSDPMQTNILGIQSMDVMEFDCNYTLNDYKTLKELEGTTQHFAVWFGGNEPTESSKGKATPNGDDGKYVFDGELTVYVKGGGVNEVVGMTVSIAASTPVALSTT